MRDLFILMASYNTWMNANVYRCASELSPEALSEDRDAFFKSILGTLNHLVVADRIWLQRFAAHSDRFQALAAVRDLPKPRSLDEILFTGFEALWEHRKMLDAAIERWVQGLQEPDLAQVMCFTRMNGARECKRLDGVMLHFFNHQTHHRGQITTLLSQFGKDVGVTDLLVRLPAADPA
jgi:uncharacterized damage-inducible protein DinB